jgi:hypothetical protein
MVLMKQLDAADGVSSASDGVSSGSVPIGQALSYSHRIALAYEGVLCGS